MQHKRLEHIPSVTFRHVAKLRKVNIHTAQQLIELCNTAEKRRALAEQLEVSEVRVYDWVCSADLFRVNGLSSTYVMLLLEARVNSAERLAVQDSAELHAQLTQLNRERRTVRRLPSLKQLNSWIFFASGLPPVIYN